MRDASLLAVEEDSVIKSLNLLEYYMKISGKDIRHAGGQIDLDEEENARGPLSYRSHRIRYFLHSYSLFLVYGQSTGN